MDLARDEALTQFKRYGGSWKQPGGVTRRKKRAIRTFRGARAVRRFSTGATGWIGTSSARSTQAASGGNTPISMLAFSDNRAAVVGREQATTEPTGVKVVISSLTANTPLSTQRTQYQHFRRSGSSPLSITGTVRRCSEARWMRATLSESAHPNRSTPSTHRMATSLHAGDSRVETPLQSIAPALADNPASHCYPLLHVIAQAGF